jgi:putative flippase GtrA
MTPNSNDEQVPQGFSLGSHRPMEEGALAPGMPVVPIPQDPFLPKGPLQRFVNLISGAQFLRYIGVGLFNTVFGYCTFALTLFLLNRIAPPRFLYLTVIAASLISTPLNITVAYFGYKFFVFKTRGNYLMEWFKCFGVYGVGMLPGLLALSAVTRLLQTLIHAHGPALHADLAAIATHLSGPPLSVLKKFSSGKTAAGYLAGAVVQGFTTIFSFVGHKKVTFKAKPTT